MKKEFLIILFIGIISFAQDTPGNLQFNRVVNFSGSQAVTPSAKVFNSFTIPDGKVWKIQSIGLASYSPTTGQLSPFTAGTGSGIKWLFARFNEIIVYVTNNNYDQQNHFPVWLESGNYDFKINSSSSNSSANILASYTAIEFNIIPE